MLPRHRQSLALLITVFVLAAGCGGPKNPPQLSPEGTMAVKGRAVVNAARAVVPIIDQQIQAGRIPQDAGVKVLLGIRQVYIQAGTLANALDIVDRAKTASEGQTGLTAAKSALSSIQKSLDDGLTGLNSDIVTAVRQLLKNLTDAIEEVRSVVSGAPPEPAFNLEP